MKGKRLKARAKKRADANKNICGQKMRFSTIDKAWDGAASKYIKYNCLFTAYKCPHKNHYHITNTPSLGDLSHIPERHKGLFLTYTIDDSNLEPTFWDKLRKFLL